ncbi:hypothetical protein E2I00_002463, partial [Balaenoptera physalus]
MLCSSQKKPADPHLYHVNVTMETRCPQVPYLTLMLPGTLPHTSLHITSANRPCGIRSRARMHSSLTVVSFGQRRKVTAAMEPKVTCVLVMVFALALSSLAQGEA